MGPFMGNTLNNKSVVGTIFSFHDLPFWGVKRVFTACIN